MSAEPTRLDLDLVSYNVLFPQPREKAAKEYPKCTAEAIDPIARQQRVWCRLEANVTKRRIVCLQELTRDWYAELLPTMLANGYMIVAANYGHASNGFMGVAVAYPVEKYVLVCVDMPCVAERADWPLPPSAAIPGAPRNAVELARCRANVMVLLRLRCLETQKEFVVGTYHMPCMYDRPEVMQLHTAGAVSQAQVFANGDPLVLAGDFNFAPDNHCYLIATRTRTHRADERAILSAHPSLCKEHLRTHATMRSAYAVAHGTEPAFTHYSYTEWRGPNLFSGTIDYIFISDHFTHVAATKLPDSIADFATPLPTTEEPSDHLELHARVWTKAK